MAFEDKAIVAEKAGDYLSAIENYTQAVDLIKLMGMSTEYRFKAAQLFQNLARLNTELGRFGEAILNYKDAIASYLAGEEEVKKIYRGLAECHSSIGTCYLIDSKYKLGLAGFEEALKYNKILIELEEGEQQKRVIDYAILNSALAIFCAINLEKEFNDIEPFLKQGIALSEENGIKGFATDLCHFFTALFENDISTSYKLLKNIIEYAPNSYFLSFNLHNMLIGLIFDLAARNIPSVRIQVQSDDFAEKGEVIIPRKVYEEMIIYALSYANRKMPKSKFQEVLALILGTVKKDNVIITDIVPMTAGSEEDVEFKDEDYAKASEINAEAAERGEFIVGWYHTHPGLGLFLSATDIFNQLGYQSLNEKAIAIVFDFTQMTPIKSGFAVFRLNDPTLAAASYHTVPWRIKESEKDSHFEYLSLFNNFLANLNHLLLESQELSITQLANESHYSELLLDEILPKLTELAYLPTTEYNSTTKIVSKRSDKKN